MNNMTPDELCRKAFEEWWKSPAPPIEEFGRPYIDNLERSTFEAYKAAWSRQQAVIDVMEGVLIMLSKRQIATWYPSTQMPRDKGYYAGWDDAEYAVKQALSRVAELRGEL